MDETWWISGVRLAGGFHLVTLGLACFTPIPPDWTKNLARLPELHRRFAVAQNFFIGAIIAWFGLLCLAFAPVLVDGTVSSRLWCAAIALWWGGRLVVLPWLRVWPRLTGLFWRAGFALLVAECATYALAFGWLAGRGRG